MNLAEIKDKIPCGEGLWRVVMWDGKWGVIDGKNKIVLPAIYDYVGGYIDGLVRVVTASDQKWGMCNKDGDEVIPCVYDFVDSFSEELAAASFQGKMGFIDKQGNVVIPFIYDWAGDFIKGKAMVRVGSAYLCIDKELNYYRTLVDEFLGRIPLPKRYKCKKCVCYNDKLITGLCCKFGSDL